MDNKPIAINATRKGQTAKRTPSGGRMPPSRTKQQTPQLADSREGRVRVVIETVRPEVEGGQYPVKRVAGETVTVDAHIFADGHDALECRLLHKKHDDVDWIETPMSPVGNDRWRASFVVQELGRYLYTIEAWADHFVTWRRDMAKRLEANQSEAIDLLIGAQLVEEAVSRASITDAAELGMWAQRLQSAADSPSEHLISLDPALGALMQRYPNRDFAQRYPKELTVFTERLRARYSSWYEVFPRSCAKELGRHGTFADCESWLPYISRMGFDVLYLPPIHPIGITNRKGKNNATTAEPDDFGSPWAIGGKAGGHKAVNPDLGTLEDFRRLIAAAAGYGIEIAMDIAYQCTPDHPYVELHPDWFRQRPDGTIQYAENPPKKYQDIYPIDFESPDWPAMWEELRDVVLFWIGHGVRIFRVDNPHTKAFGFWEWMIDSVREAHPDVIFLSEAFTRPKVMYRLAKVGFSQSYTYFTWRNTKEELTEYFTGMATSGVAEYFRPNLWPNTPDILPEYLQVSGRPGFMIRLALAATLGSSYGIYGPAFELCENAPRTPGSEEYLNSEKYEIRQRDLDSPWSLSSYIGRINRIRNGNPALQQTWNFTFHEIDNPMMLCYSKATADGSNVLLVIVNLDPHHTQAGWTNLQLEALGVEPSVTYQAHDLLGDGRYLWTGARNYVELNPTEQPVHIMQIRRKTRTERDFDYYL